MRQRVLTREQVRQVDRDAVEKYGIPSIVLMENAARQAADHAVEMLSGTGASNRVLILCGGGNNGGDGLAAARHLHNRGVAMAIVLLKSPDDYTGDAKINLDICLAMKLPAVKAADHALTVLGHISPPALILDCLLGTGLTGNVRGEMLDVIGWINEQTTPVLAIDIPSGLDCDTGKPLGAAVRATRTLTFVGMKRGFIQPGASEYTGEVHIADIGAPRELIESLSSPS